MFKNLKIGARLGFGFAIVLVLLIVVTVIGVLRVGELKTEINNLVTDKNLKAKAANEIIQAVLEADGSRRFILILRNDETTRIEIEKRAAISKRVTSLFEDLDKLSYGEKGKSRL